MKTITFLVFLFLAVTGLSQVVPYHVSWSGYSFSSKYRGIHKVTAETYHSEKDLSRKKHRSFDEIYFDAMGRTIRSIHWVENEQIDLQQCWEYKDDGCPHLVRCDGGNFPPHYQRFTCHDGRIDTLLGSMIENTVVRKFDNKGKCILELIYKTSNLDNKTYQLADSVALEYDANGFFTGSIGIGHASSVEYSGDSITVLFALNGIVVSRREILCGQDGLPVTMRTWNYDNRKKKYVLSAHSTFRYEHRR